MYLNKRRINIDVKNSPYVHKNRDSVYSNNNYNKGGATYVRNNNNNQYNNSLSDIMS